MIESEYQHHAEQMEAARAEFSKLFASECERQSFKDCRLTREQFITMQDFCWRVFARGKGLLK